MGPKKHLSMVLVFAVALLSIVVILYFSGAFVPKKIKTGKYHTETVDRGEVISMIMASGVVASENEVLMLSPVSSIIRSILKEPGNQVKTGEIILQLHTQPVEDEIEKLKDQLEVKKNNLEKTQLNAKSTKIDLDYGEEVKKLKIVSLKSQLSDQEQLLEVGGISPSKIEETKQEITLAEKDLANMQEKNTIRLQQLTAEEKGLLLQISIDEKLLHEKQILLGKMNVRAPSSGIILDIAGKVGEKVPVDKMLVQMSDLSSFKLTGSIDEQYATHIHTGATVFVMIENEKLEGTIGSITPMVENKKVQFNVHLTESNNPKLIANQNVQIQILNFKKENLLRIKNLPDFESGKKCKVFVVNGEKAVKREVVVGIVGDEYSEIISGLSEGDIVISDDLSAFRHLNEIELNN